MSSVPEKIKNLYPFVDDIDTPLPSTWSVVNKDNLIRLSTRKTTAFAINRSKIRNGKTAWIVADNVIPRACGFYYFELRIIKKPKPYFMEFGLTEDKFKNKWGYTFTGSTTKNDNLADIYYGESFQEDDVVGCGFDLVYETCFFTKNGRAFGIAFEDISQRVFPFLNVELGVTVKANFGQRDFLFDIRNIIKHNIADTSYVINSVKVTHSDTDTINKIVLQHLISKGYWDAAVSFAKTTGLSLCSAVNKINSSGILSDIKNGRILAAMKKIKTNFPNLFKKDKSLVILLRCQLIIEMILELHENRNSSGSSSEVNEASLVLENQEEENKSSEEEDRLPEGEEEKEENNFDKEEKTSQQKFVDDYLKLFDEFGNIDYNTYAFRNCRNSVHNAKELQRQNDLLPCPDNKEQSDDNNESEFENSPEPNVAPLIPENQNEENQLPEEENNINLINFDEEERNSQLKIVENYIKLFDEFGNVDYNTYAFRNYPNDVPNAEELQRQNDLLFCPDNQEQSDDNNESESENDSDDASSAEEAQHEDDSSVYSDDQETSDDTTENTITDLYVIKFCKKTYSMIKNMECDEEERKLLKSILDEATSFLAYENPWNSPSYKKLLPENRLVLCEVVNRKLLKYHKLPPRSYFIFIMSQVEKLMGIGAANGLFHPAPIMDLLYYRASLPESDDK